MEVAGQIDRSTRGAPAKRAGLGMGARRLALLGVVLLVAACSSLKLGYNHADTLLLYSLDSYLSLDDQQERLAGERVRELLQWHRATQLAGYTQLLADAQRALAGHVRADEVIGLQRQVYARLALISDHAAPDLAALARTLTAAQIDHLAGKLARETSKARRELVRFAGAADPLANRMRRYSERIEWWFGSINPEQAQILRAELAARPDGEAWWMDERERRHAELVALLQWVHDERPAAAEAASRIRAYFAQLDAPADAARRAALAEYRRANAELIARLVNAATPSQREALAKKLRGYAEDLTALAGAARG